MGEANLVLFLALEWLDFLRLRLSFQLTWLNPNRLNIPRLDFSGLQTAGSWKDANVRPVTLMFAEFLLILPLLLSEDGLVLLLILLRDFLVGSSALI